MTFEWNENNVLSAKDKLLYDKLNTIGAQVSGRASQLAPKDRGQLAGSIDYRLLISNRNKKVRIEANTEYAAIQELGGDIYPVDAKALSVPVHNDAKGKSPKDFIDLVYIPGNDHRAPLLVRKRGRGFNKERFDIMFVLVKKVTIPAHPYLRRAVYQNQNFIMDLLRGS